MALKTTFIRSCNGHEVTSYLRELAAAGAIENTTQQLIDAVGEGSIPPSIFKLWFSISHTPDILKKAFKQNISVYIRKAAIERLQKCLESPKWKDTWDGFGGTQGFLELFRGFSVSEVGDTCRVIGSSTKGSDNEKRGAVTDLYNSLSSQKSDPRPLEQCYRYLILGGTSEAVAQVAYSPLEKWSTRQKSLLIRNHPAIMQESAAKMVVDFDGPDHPWLFVLIREFPATAGTDRKISSSMEFSLELIRKLVDKDHVSQITDETFLNQIVLPFLARALKKHTAWETIEEIFELTQKYTEKYPSMLQALETEYTGKYTALDRYAVQCWIRKPDIFEKHLRLLLRTLSKTPGRVNFYQLTRAVQRNTGISKSKLYEVFKIYLNARALEKHENDISLDLALKRITGRMSIDFLLELNPEDALDLLERMRKIKGDESIDAGYYCRIPWGLPKDTTVYPDRYEKVIDSDLFKVWLLQQLHQQEAAEELARTKIAERKKAQETPDTELREIHARGVFFYAIISGSLSIFDNAVDWTKRIVRDPGIKLYTEIPEQLAGLLSGLPLDPVNGEDLDVTALGDRVLFANRILVKMMDLIDSALSEPEFDLDRWHGTILLFQKVIVNRVKRSSELQGKLTEDEIYNVLWEDTLSMMIALEEKCLKKGYNELNLSPAGLLGYNPWSHDRYHERENIVRVTSTQESTYRFFDNLAQGRDKLWRDHRASENPAVTKLPEPFPRGLPLQRLFSPLYFNISEPLENLAPYIASRIKSTLFIPQEASRVPIPVETDLWVAVGTFVDDYNKALSYFVPDALSIEDTLERLDTVWYYAIGPLSEGRLNSDEAIRYWRRRFNRFMNESPDKKLPRRSLDGKQASDLSKEKAEGLWLKARKDWSDKILNEPHEEPLRIPTVKTPTETLEWDLVERPKGTAKPRKISPPLYIDVSSDPGFAKEHLKQDSDEDEDGEDRGIAKYEIPGRTYWRSKVWTRGKSAQAKSEFQLQEAQVLSSLLYIDAKISEQDKILQTPFPSAEDARYPSSCFSHESLSVLALPDETPTNTRRSRRGGRGRGGRRGRGGQITSDSKLDSDATSKAVMKTLHNHINVVPPKLLLRLVEKAFNLLPTLDPLKDEYLLVTSLAFKTLALLEKSDQPNLASEIVIRTVTEFPEAATWQKLVLNSGFLRSLVPSDAQDCIAKVRDVIFSALEEMGKKKEKSETSNEDSVQEPKRSAFVKVATIKLFVELLEDADIVLQEYTLKTVRTIAEKASQSQIHLVLISYLLRGLKSCKSIYKDHLSILSIISNKTPESQVQKAVLNVLTFALKTSKLDDDAQALAVSMLSTIYENTSDAEVHGEIMRYFIQSLENPEADDDFRSLSLSMVSKMFPDLTIPESKPIQTMMDYLICSVETSTGDVLDQTFSIMERFISICGNWSEQDLMTEAKWSESEETLELVEIYADVGKFRPILSKLIKFQEKLQNCKPKDTDKEDVEVQQARIKKYEKLNGMLTERIMLPIAKELQVQTSKYYSIFLQNYGVDKDTQQTLKIPSLALNRDLHEKLMEVGGCGDAMAYILEEYVSYVIYTLDPPQVIKDLNKKFEDDETLGKQDSVKNWSSVYGKGTEIISSQNLISSLVKKIDSAGYEIVSDSFKVQYMRLYKFAIAWEGENGYRGFSKSLSKQLRPSKPDKPWTKHVSPILEEVIQYTESLRSDSLKGLRTSNGKLSVLPDTFFHRIWLLKYPVGSEESDQETRCRTIAEQISEIAKEAVASILITSRLYELKEALSWLCNDEEDILVAIHLGNLENTSLPTLTLPDYIRLQLASSLIGSRSSTKSEVSQQKIQGMLDSWTDSEIEEVRSLGYHTNVPELKLEQLEDQAISETKKHKRRQIERRSLRKNRKRVSRWAALDFGDDEKEKEAIASAMRDELATGWEADFGPVTAW